MKTMNRKRIGPVPISLVAALALAAFLSVGLLLGLNGSTPVAAQDAADCMVKNTGAAADGMDTADLETTMGACSTTESSATVSLAGAIGREDSDELTVYLYAKNGTIAGGKTVTNVWDHDAQEGDATSTRFSTITKTIPKGIPPSAGGVPEKRSTVDIMVTPASGQSKVTLYVYYANVPPEMRDFDHDGDTDSDDQVYQIDAPTALVDGTFEVDATSGTITIIFLDAPALGEEGADRNEIIDDFMQCVKTSGAAANAMFPTDGTDMDGNMANCGEFGDNYELDSKDKAESRSKLVVRIGTGTDLANMIKMLPNGKELDYTVGKDDAVTIYAVIKDASGEARPGTEVSFDVSSMPANIGPRSRTEDAMQAVGTGATATSKQILVEGAAASDATDNPLGIMVGDAVAMREIGDLKGTAYRVSVKVMAGDLNLGTVHIAKAGKPTMLDAGIYNKMCIGGGDDMDEFVMGMKDCVMVMGDKARFPQGGMFAVSATAKDANGTKALGEAGKWMIKDLSTSKVVSSKMDKDPMAYILTVKNDAPLGMHTLTLTHASDDVADVMLHFYVAGPPVKYMVDPMKTYIPLRNRDDFTVTAVDKNGGVPHFITKDNPDTTDVVEVANHMVGIDATYGEVRGAKVDNDVLTLDTSTGEGTFTYTLPRDTSDGESFAIFVSKGDMQVEITVIAGEEPPAMTAPGMPMSVKATATSDTEIKVTWAAPASNGNSAITGYMVQSKYMMADGTMSAWMDVDPAPAHMGMDMMYMDMDLTAETTYYYQVAATNDIGTGKYSDGTAMATTMVTGSMLNHDPEPVGELDAVMLTMGDDPATVDVSGAFSDADDDTLTYTATSSMTDYATVMVDGSTVTITAVAAGDATIMVTATDPAGAMAKQTFMVTVEAAAPMLTAPSITSVMSNSAGMATIMLMPGENAELHWVWAQPTDLSQGMYPDKAAAGDATSVTMSGLTSGMSYWFMAIAGRGEKGHEEWSVWSGWSAATPIK